MVKVGHYYVTNASNNGVMVVGVANADKNIAGDRLCYSPAVDGSGGLAQASTHQPQLPPTPMAIICTERSMKAVEEF